MKRTDNGSYAMFRKDSLDGLRLCIILRFEQIFQNSR